MMTAKTIYLVRHAEPAGIDSQGFYLGQSDPPLSPAGVKQAGRLAETFKGKPIRAIYCSDLARALETASIIARVLRCRPVKVKAFREINLGDWEGLSTAEVQERYPGEYEKRGADFVRYRPPGGESFADLHRRVIPAFFRVVEESAGDLVIVAHAGVNRVILCELLGLELNKLFSIEQTYARVDVIRKNERGYTVGGFEN